MAGISIFTGGLTAVAGGLATGTGVGAGLLVDGSRRFGAVGFGTGVLGCSVLAEDCTGPVAVGDSRGVHPAAIMSTTVVATMINPYRRRGFCTPFTFHSRHGSGGGAGDPLRPLHLGRRRPD